MPFRSRRRYRSRRFRRRTRRRITRRRRSVRVSLVRNVNVLPSSITTKLKYTDEFTLTPGAAGSVATYLFNLNSLYDPNRTGTGHQPYGFDQLAAWYQRYRVYKCSWRIQASPGGIGWITVVPQNHAGVTTDRNLVNEFPRAVSRSVTAYTGLGQGLKGHIYIPKLPAVKSYAYRSDDAYQALVSASPTEIICLSINWSPGNPSSTIACDFMIHMVFTAEFFDPAFVTGS